LSLAAAKHPQLCPQRLQSQEDAAYLSLLLLLLLLLLRREGGEKGESERQVLIRFSATFTFAELPKLQGSAA